MNHIDTQKAMILEWLLAGLPIQHLEAEIRFGCANVRNRVCELRKEGFPIQGKLVPVQTRFGKKHVMRYFL